jgi:hypothetical protein
MQEYDIYKSLFVYKMKNKEVRQGQSRQYPEKYRVD